MSSICDQRSELEGFIALNDNKGIVACLERLMRDGRATDDELLLLGVLLFLPPFVDSDSSSRVLTGLMDGPKSLEAASWNAYRYGVVQPDGDTSFGRVLERHPGSAVARHLAGVVALADGGHNKFLIENRESRRIALFPANMLIALDNDNEIGVDEKCALIRTCVDMFVSKTAEDDSSVCTVRGLLSRKWDNLITEVRVTSQYWDVLVRSHGFEAAVSG